MITMEPKPNEPVMRCDMHFTVGASRD